MNLEKMIFKDRSLTFREFAMKEAVPLAEIQRFVLELLCDREDAAVFGAQAVNAYVDEPRMSQDIDILGERQAENYQCDATPLRPFRPTLPEGE